LALVVASLHSNAGIRSSWVDAAKAVFPEELARSAAGNQQARELLLQVRANLVRSHIRTPFTAVGGQEKRLAHYVQFVGLNNQSATATCSAAVAFKGLHRIPLSK
jgi:hypothetical protein